MSQRPGTEVGLQNSVERLSIHPSHHPSLFGPDSTSSTTRQPSNIRPGIIAIALTLLSPFLSSYRPVSKVLRMACGRWAALRSAEVVLSQLFLPILDENIFCSRLAPRFALNIDAAFGAALDRQPLRRAQVTERCQRNASLLATLLCRSFCLLGSRAWCGDNIIIFS